MLKISISHKAADLQLILNICNQLTINSTNFIDYEDYYNLQSFCKSIRNKKENLQNRYRRKPINTVLISSNINELKSLEKLYDLNYTYFFTDGNIYQRLMFTNIIQQFIHYKTNHIYAPFS